MSFSKLVGQSKLKKRLSEEACLKRANSFLITGQRGIGKHSFAEEFAAAFLCEKPGEDGACGKCNNCIYFQNNTHPDIKRIEDTSGKKFIPVDSIKNEVIADIDSAPQIAQNKVFIINGDKLNNEGQNALLKSLEEPPKGIVFILLASDSSNLLPTVNSRVIELKIDLYDASEIKDILSMDNPEISQSQLDSAADFSGGVPGKALTLVNDDTFGALREDILNLILAMPDLGYTDVLVDKYKLFDENKKDKERIDEMLLILTWVLGDVMKLVASPDTRELKNEDFRDRLTAFTEAHNYLTTGRIGNCVDAITEVRKGMQVNSNFEGLMCDMLLKILKEFKR